MPIRTERFRLKLMQFSYSISHVPGKQLIIPVSDLLSRQPVTHELTREEKELSLDTENYVDSVFRQLPATDMRLQEIKEKQGRDPVCQTLIRYKCIVKMGGLKQRAERVKLEKYIGLIREKFQ